MSDNVGALPGPIAPTTPAHARAALAAIRAQAANPAEARMFARMLGLKEPK